MFGLLNFAIFDIIIGVKLLMAGVVFFRKFGFLVLFVFTFVLFFNFPISNVAYAASCSSNATGNWNAAGTWTSCGGGVPQAGDTVTIGAHTVTIPSGYTINQVADITIQNGGTLTQANTLTQTITGTLTIQSGGNLNHAGNSTSQDNELDFVVGGLDVQSGGTINVDALGFDGGYYESPDDVAANGPGKGTGGGSVGVYVSPGGGGGYGGAGGTGVNGDGPGAGGSTYGDARAPTAIGSGGAGSNYANGGAGGGYAHINITGGGTATVAGTISAVGGAGEVNGTYGQAGGGSGGAIWIDFEDGGTFAGGGSISAAGGTAVASMPNLKAGGTGGGGRIIVGGYATKTFSGTTNVAAGDTSGSTGQSQAYGSAGTAVTGIASTNVEPATTLTSSTNVVTVSFTTSKAIPADGKVDVIFPAGFNVTSASGGTCSTMDGNFSTSVSSQTVTITRSGGSSQAAAAETCTINNIVNTASTGSGGTYTIQVKDASNNISDKDASVTADIYVSGNGGWDGGGADDDWCTDANWGNNSEPGTSTAVSIDTTVLGAGVTVTTSGCVTEGNNLKFSTLTIGGSSTATLEVQQNINSSSANITIASGGVVQQKTTTTQTITGTLLIQSGGKLTHTDNSTAQSYEVDFSAATITIDNGGSIDADALGYDANQGETGGKGGGAACAGGGGAHGGNGGASQTWGGCTSSGGTAYGSSTNPITMGSGGGTRSGNTATTASQGGGYIKLNVTGTITINGTITADGAASTGASGGYGFGGGAGGGINVSAAVIAGTPQSITATGGASSNESIDGGGGGGGRIYFGYSSSTTIGVSNTDVGGGTGNSATAGSAGSETVTQTNNAPTATTPSSISQATDGTGNVTFSTTIADADQNSNTVKVEISDNGGTTWYDAQITSVAGTVGSPTVDNDQAYQLRSVTTTSNNALTVVWASQHASNGNGGVDNADQSDIQVRVTPNDGTVDGTTQTSSSFSVDNLDPLGLGSFAVSGETTTTTSLSWTVATEANFNHYEIWYGTSQSNVQNRSGATEWDNSDDATLATRTTAATTITGLSVNTQYYYKIWALDNSGNEMTVADITAYTSANTPSAPTVTAASTSSLTVVVAQNSNPSATTYAIKVGTQYVQANASLGASEVWQTYATWGSASGVVVTGLSANTQYAVSVKARNGDSDETSLSSSTSKYTLASAVTSVTLSNATSKTAYGLSLSWTNNGQTGVKIDLSSVGGGACDSTYDVGDYDTASSNPSSPRSISAAASTCYKARILSYNGDGILNSTDSAVSNELTTPAAQVTGLAYGSSDINFITWAWTSVSGATNYKVYRASDDALIGETGNTTASYTQTTVTSGGAAVSANTQYTVYARAVDANGEGIASSSAAAYTTANLPTSLSHEAASQTTDSMKWTWASGGSQQDFYAYMTTPTTNSGFITDLFWLVSSTLSANTQYSFFVKSRNAENTQTSAVSASAYTSQSAPTGITFSSIATDSITLTADGTFANLTTASSGIRFRNTTTSADNTLQVVNWTNSSLSPNTQYSYTVSAKNGDGDETSTVTGSKYTLASTVTALTVTNATTTTTLAFQLSWTNNGQTGMKIEQDSGCDGTYDATAVYDNSTTNATSPYTVNTGLAANTCYIYKISSYNGNGTINSNSVATSAQITTPPAAPEGFVTGGVTATSFTINWTAVTGATSYTVYESTSGTSQGDTTSPSYVFREKTPGTAYSYYVRSSNANGFSIVSAVIALTTVSTASTSGSGGGGSGGGGNTYVDIVRKADEKKDEKKAEEAKKEEAGKVADEAEDDRREEAGDDGGGLEVDERREEQGNGGTTDEGGGGGGSDGGADVIVEEEARFKVEKVLKDEQKKEKVASEQEKIAIDELALLRRATVSFSDTVATINEENPIPREFIDFAVRKTQVFGSVLKDQRRASEKVLSEKAKKIEKIFKMNFDDLPEEEKLEIVAIVENRLRDELEVALKRESANNKKNPLLMPYASVLKASGYDSGKSITLYLGHDEFVEVKNEKEIESVISLVSNKLVTKGTDLNNDGVDDKIQLSIDLPLLNDDSDGDGIGVADELGFGLNPYEKDYLSVLPRIYVHQYSGISKIYTGKSPIINLLGGKSGSKVKVSLVNKKDSSRQIYVGEVVLDDESKGVITGKDVPVGEYYIIALSEDGISELAEIEVTDSTDAPDIVFARDEFLKRVFENFPKFVSVVIKKILIEMVQKVKPRLIKGRAAAGSMVFVKWKSLTLSSVVIADASQGEFQVEVPAELEEGDHEAIVYVFNREKSLLSNVSNLFFRWY